ncbi:MAG TPA: choice-of-anchor Q domain-containing protein [Verrucomicrobiae bacterium]|jgi:hypothetical protein
MTLTKHAVLWIVSFALLSVQLARAQTFVVNTPGDTHAANPVSSPNDSNGHISLRSAIEAANAQTGATISLPVGNYNLTLGELDLAPNGSKTNTIIATGTTGSTIVSQTDNSNRVFNIDVNSAGGAKVALEGITIQGGHDHADYLGGAGILAGSITSTPLDTLVLSNCVILNNNCTPPNTNYTAQPGGGVQMAGGNLTVTGCLFSNNTSAASFGGAIAFIAPATVGGGSGGTLVISNSLFSNNSMTNTSASGPDGGGAVYLNTTTNAVHAIGSSIFSNNFALGPALGDVVGGAIYLNTGTLNVNASTFTSNSVSGPLQEGGAIDVDSGSLNITFSRLLGNAGLGGGSAIFNHLLNNATTSAENDWWVSDAGPGLAVSGFGVNAWLELNLFADPNPVLVNNPATLFATFVTNSAGVPVPPANLGLLIGLPITFGGAVIGTISGMQTTIQNSGTATADYTAVALGTDNVNATVDGVTVAVQIIIAATNLNVVNTNDSGAGSLRQAIATIFPGGTIRFRPNLDGTTIYLTNGELLVTQNMTIVGPGANQLTINGNYNGRVFDIGPGATNFISGLTISGGLADNAILNPALGGGIFNAGVLTLSNCVVCGNLATNASTGWGGGIYSTNILSLIGCTIGPTNEAGLVGGGIYAHFNSLLQMLNCTVASNTSPFEIGGVAANSGALTFLTNCTITGNSDGTFAGGYGSAQSPQFENTIIAGNVSTSGFPDVYTLGDLVVSAGYNLIGTTNGTTGWLATDLAGNTNSPLNARLGGLANNGGPTMTSALLISPNSPAINAGNPAAAPSFDQRGPGFPRLVGNLMDIGAYELIPPPLGISHLPNQIILSWPTNVAGYRVQSTTNLTLPNSWGLAGAPVIIGNQYEVTTNTSGGKQYFRLEAQ